LNGVVAPSTCMRLPHTAIHNKRTTPESRPRRYRRRRSRRREEQGRAAKSPGRGRGLRRGAYATEPGAHAALPELPAPGPTAVPARRQPAGTPRTRRRAATRRGPKRGAAAASEQTCMAEAGRAANPAAARQAAALRGSRHPCEQGRISRADPATRPRPVPATTRRPVPGRPRRCPQLTPCTSLPTPRKSRP
jgi:hypothetical protein